MGTAGKLLRHRLRLVAILVGGPVLLVAACSVAYGVYDGMVRIDGGEFREIVDRDLPAGSSETDVIAFMRRTEARPPAKAEVFTTESARPASDFNRGCFGHCPLAHVQPLSPVIVMRLQNTRGGSFICDPGGVAVYFVLDSARRLQETVIEDLYTCL